MLTPSSNFASKSFLLVLTTIWLSLVSCRTKKMATSANSEIRNEMLSGAQLKFKVEIIDTPIITKCPSEFGKPAISDAKNVLEGFNLQPAKKIIVTGETATAIASEGEVTKTEDSKLEEKLPAESGFSIVQMMFFFILLLVISLVCRRI